MTLNAQLSEAMHALGYNPNLETIKLETKLLKYLALIQKWNEVHNLTAIRNSEAMLTHHIIDSLVVIPHIAGTKIADIGSGAGLPGIPIAIMKPDWRVTLIESNKKKTAFQQQVIIELELENIEIIADRAENYQTNSQFNTIISRALSSLNEFINMSAHLGNNEMQNSRYVAMKASNVEQEIENLPDGYSLDKIVPLSVPGLNAERQLIIIKHS